MNTTTTMNTTTNTTTRDTLQVRAIVSPKTGKVSKTAERAYNALQGQSRQIGLSVALGGKNALMVKTAKSGFENEVITLDSLLSTTTANTGVFRDVFTLLVAEYGNAVEGQKGKEACKAVLSIAISNGKSKLEAAHQDAPKQVLRWSEYVDLATARLTSLTAIIDHQEGLRLAAMEARKANLT